MRTSIIALAFAALAHAASWEIFARSEQAELDFNPDTFDVHNFDPAMYRVTFITDGDVTIGSHGFNVSERINDPPDDLTRPQPGDEPYHLPQECIDRGDPNDHLYYCLPKNDASQCNVAFYVPHTPRPPGGKSTIDAFIYDSECTRVRGCRLDVQKARHWWEVDSDLKYMLKAQDKGNTGPHFQYKDFDCPEWPWCRGWSWVLVDRQFGDSIWLYRHGFKCDQP